MIKYLMARRRTRREARQAVVLGQLLLHGEQTVNAIQRRTLGMSLVQVFNALQELETQGRVASRWAIGPYPRRRVYRIADRALAPLGHSEECP